MKSNKAYGIDCAITAEALQYSDDVMVGTVRGGGGWVQNT